MIKKFLLPLLAFALLAVSGFAQESTPVQTVQSAVATSQTGWAGFAAISASAFVFGMLIAYGRKGKK